ncbi:MAG: homoserine kinase type II [Candidatus Azotimanducaceae bacterium]|jgi:homoserine kinase type II
MATYTTFERASLERYLIMFDLGELSEFEAITSGIENSNYYVRFENTDFEYVLTITEDLDFAQVPFFNDLLQALAKSGIPVPEPQRTLDGMSSTIFKSKPTWLFNRLPGHHPDIPNDTQCGEIGVALAKLHIAGRKAKYNRDNAYHSGWAKETFANVAPNLNDTDRQSLQLSVERYHSERQDDAELPRGTIHGDLFRDNALFVDNALTGVIDFYHACDDYFIQDIAISINDWCCEQGADVPEKEQALLAGYTSIRPLELAEQTALPRFREYAAMRFSLTRLLAGRAGNPIKNPREFLELLDRLQSGQDT